MEQGITIIDNFNYKGRKFLDERQSCETLVQLKSIPEYQIPDGFIIYVKENKTHYQFDIQNSIDPTTGKWRMFKFTGSNIIDCGEF